MRRLAWSIIISLLSMSTIAHAQNASPSRGPTLTQSNARAAFTALEALAGSWSGVVTTEPHNPDVEGPIQATMSVASRGSVLMHEIAPGGMPEPTMIYVEHDRLTMVHYCEAGNRPRLVARRSRDENTVEFDFVDVSGSKNPTYLNHFVFTLIDPDHHTEDWTFMLPGYKLLRAHFDLKRTSENTPQKN